MFANKPRTCRMKNLFTPLKCERSVKASERCAMSRAQRRSDKCHRHVQYVTALPHQISLLPRVPHPHPYHSLVSLVHSPPTTAAWSGGRHRDSHPVAPVPPAPVAMVPRTASITDSEKPFWSVVRERLAADRGGFRPSTLTLSTCHRGRLQIKFSASNELLERERCFATRFQPWGTNLFCG